MKCQDVWKIEPGITRLLPSVFYWIFKTTKLMPCWIMLDPGLFHHPALCLPATSPSFDWVSGQNWTPELAPTPATRSLPTFIGAFSNKRAGDCRCCRNVPGTSPLPNTCLNGCTGPHSTCISPESILLATSHLGISWRWLFECSAHPWPTVSFFRVL